METMLLECLRRYWRNTPGRSLSLTALQWGLIACGDLRADAQARGGLAEIRINRRYGQGCHLRGFCRGKLEPPKHRARTVHDLYFQPKY
jgi:hypothetical protein